MNEPVFLHWAHAMSTVLAGSLCMLIGFRIIGKSPGNSERYDAWHARCAPWLRWGGGVLLAFGLLRFFIKS